MSSLLDGPDLSNRCFPDDWQSVGTTGSRAKRQKIVIVPYRRDFRVDGDVADVAPPRPNWFAKAVKALFELGELEPNWDSYGADPIPAASIRNALEFLLTLGRDTPPPGIVPINRGTVGFAWHLSQIDLEVEVVSRDELYVAVEDYQSGEEWEGSVTSDRSKLMKHIKRLSEK